MPFKRLLPTLVFTPHHTQGLTRVEKRTNRGSQLNLQHKTKPQNNEKQT